MPRLQPPAGCITAKQAATRLGVSEAMLSRYVREDKLKRYGPPDRKHKFYKISEVEALLAAERYVYMPGQWRNNPTSTFGLATEKDLPAIVEISRAIFGDPIASVDSRVALLRKNPETFFILREHEKQQVVGFASVYPLKKEVIEHLMHAEGNTITPEDIEPYEPGKPVHLYIRVVGIDPQYDQHRKHAYGARIVHGLFSFFFDLAERSIEVVTITAKSHKPDGIRLLRKMGIPQLRSRTPGISLFQVVVAECGFPLFERYSDILSGAIETQSHLTPTETPTEEKTVKSPPTQESSQSLQPQKSALPVGYIGFREMARRHGIRENTVRDAVESGRLQAEEGQWVAGRASVQRAFNLEQQAAFVKFYSTNEKTRDKFHQCNDLHCSCHGK